MAYSTVTIICSTEVIPKIVETLVPLIVATQQPKNETMDILPEERDLVGRIDTPPKRKFKQKKHFCPVPECKRTKAVYLYQHLRSKHKMPFSEMKKWRKLAKQQ